MYSLGRIDEYERTLQSQIDEYEVTGIGAEGIARLYAWGNRPDEAFRWLEIMVEDHGPEQASTVKTEFYEPIKSDPRYQAFLERNGVSDLPPGLVPFNPQYPPALQQAIDQAARR